jgi:hypothetical protein
MLTINWSHRELRRITSHPATKYCPQSITRELQFHTSPNSVFRHRKNTLAVASVIQVSLSSMLSRLSTLMNPWCSSTHPIELDRHQSSGTRASVRMVHGHCGQSKPSSLWWNYVGGNARAGSDLVSATRKHQSLLHPASLARRSSVPCAVHHRGSRRVKKRKAEGLSVKGQWHRE